MKTLLKALGSIIIGAVIIAGGYLIIEPAFGAFQTVGGTTYRLQSSIGVNNTTIVLSSFKNRSNIPWTMSLLNTDIVYATLDPQTSSSEFVSFTNITQNADGTATLTGVTRGLSDFYPYTASSTLQRAHAGQSTFIISDAPQVFAEYAAKRNNENITGVFNFLSLPTTSVVCSTSVQFCNKAYIDAQVVAGAPAAGYVIPGIGIISTGLDMANGVASTTYLGTQYANFLSAENSTSTPNGALAAFHAAITGSGGKLAQAFLDLTQSFTFSGGLISTATTTLNCSNVLSNGCIFNGVTYKFPSAITASSTVFSPDTSGNISLVKNNMILYQNGATLASNNTATTTLAFYIIPANLLGANDLIHIRAYFTRITGTSNNGFPEIQIGNGSASTTITNQFSGDCSQMCAIEANVQMQNATNAQRSWSTVNTVSTFIAESKLSTYDATTQLYISFRGRAVSGADSFGFQGISVELLRQ